MKKLITYILEKFGKSNRIELVDPAMEETVNGMKHQKLSNYEAERNNLIPVAERYANAVMGKEPAKDAKGYRDWVDSWNKVFHEKMRDLL